MGLDLQSLSRRELQLLAKELQLCRGNAKSDVILQHVVEFISARAADGEQRVRDALGLPAERAATGEKRAPAGGAADAGATSSDASSQEEGEAPELKHKPKPAAAVKAVASPAHASPAKATAAAAKTAKASPNPAKASPKPAQATKRKRADAAPEAELPAPAPARTATAVPKNRESAQQRPAASKAEAAPAPRRALAPIENASTATPAAAEVVALVEATDDLAFTKDGRVRCSTTAHEMKADLAVIREHLGGKRYARAHGLQAFSLAKYAPMFRAHPDDKQAALLVWCDVTESAIARSRKQIEAHMAGPRFQKQLPVWRVEQAARAQAEAEAAARKLAAQRRRLEREAPGELAPKRAKAKGSS